MSNGDGDTDETSGEDASGGSEASVASLEQRLDEAAAFLETAETESDLDAAERSLDDIADDIDAADLTDTDDKSDPAEELEARLSELREAVDEQRGPYLEDVIDAMAAVESRLEETRWTETGESDAVAAATEFATAVGERLELEDGVDHEGATGAASDLTALRESVADTDLGPDDDASTIAALLDATAEFEGALDSAEEWDDLTVREQLDAEGFYDVLTPENRRDFPAEWNAIKLYEQSGDIEPILTALEQFDSEFMQENALDALEHVAPEAAFEQVHSMVNRRNRQPIRVLGRIGDDRACDTLHDFLDAGDVKLEADTLRALGSIGSDESTQPVANRLVADDPEIRSVAARALGMIGDTRAIDPLADVLETEEANEVRASAAWALNQIGTQRALDVVAEYADDPSYLVQHEAQKAATS